MTPSEKLARPQPVGILPMPAGLLILPVAGAADAELLKQCMVKQCIAAKIPVDSPPSWNFYEDARKGNWAAALEHLGSGNEPVTAYNRFVIAPTAEGLEQLRAMLQGELRTLVEVAAFNLGLADAVPPAGELDSELLALALLSQAAAAMEHNEHDQAVPLLERAIGAAREVSPLFTAQLLGQLAAMSSPELDRPKYYREAIALLADAPLPEVTTDLWMQLAMTCQENARGRHDWMNKAVEAYQQVLRSGLVPEQHSELFALAHNNLGLLFLSMRMSENGKPLSMAIAVQSFREALRICDRTAHPELGASIQLNLANALQYLPSSHPEDNLGQAVELYEELITQQRKAFDPVGYGRILSNQANALAHLGIFPPALEKLQEARKLFEWHNETELAHGAMEIVEQIHQQLGATAGKA